MRRRRVAFATALAILALGAWQVGEGLYIHAKAALAQVLLQSAWERTLAGEVRAKPWPWADTWPVARLSVPGRDVDLIVLSGATGRTLAFGPGHLEGSAAPGAPGMSIVTGHRDTHFRFLEGLRRGDELLLEGRDGARLRFSVTATRIADYRRPGISLDDTAPALTLVTCYPFDAVVPGGPLRYLVRAETVPEHAPG
jgi:sortase A